MEFDDNVFRNIPLTLLDSIFSTGNNNVAKFLRNNLLICTDEFYSKDAGVCKEYTVNKTGFNFILGKVLEKDPSFKLNDAELLYTDVVREIVSDDKKMSLELETKEFSYNLKAYRRWNPLQNIKREVKKRILVEHGLVWDYDVEGCAVTVLVQKALKQGLKEKKIPVLLELYKNKNYIRTKLMDEIGISRDKVKDIISGIFNGAKINKTGDIYKAIGRCEKTYLKMDSSPTLQRLKIDISTLWAFLKREVLESSGDVVGLANNRRLTGSDKANFYFKIELLLNNCFIEFCDKLSIKYFLQHDGFTTNKRIDVSLLENLIKETTNYIVSLSEDDLLDKITGIHREVKFKMTFFEERELEIKLEEVSYQRRLKQAKNKNV
jgi:hypothetical protein